mmetsp:Transcript_89154/g.212878  ORF Transcript_89154/g.212878 Transcript_89154/m.212878 type:complete len:309 (+) Transcript_89154:971-1897(+)
MGAASRRENCSTDLAPRRMAVPTQSTAVSPPPITTTRLSCTSKLKWSVFLRPISLSRFFFCVAVRKSMACTMLPRCRFSVERMSRHCVAPVAMITASFWLQRLPSVMSRPSSVLHLKVMPSCFRSVMRRSTFSILSSFMDGMPYIRRPPGRSALSMTSTRCPARFSCCATASPAGPDPMTQTRRPVRCRGGWGLIQPLEKPYSMIASSVVLMATGFSLMPSTQASSQGAGQVVPVNSGKLLVSRSRSSARFHSPSCTSWFQVGMRFPKGHPPPPWLGEWQVGVPQSMHRAVWVCIQLCHCWLFRVCIA